MALFLQVANDIRDEDHAGSGDVVIIGIIFFKKILNIYSNSYWKSCFLDEYSDEKARFFEELGSGSTEEDLPSSAEDDAVAEENANRWKKHLISLVKF